MLDIRSRKITVGVWFKTTRIFAALAGIRFSAKPVHCDRESFVSLGRECTHGHSCGRKALHDFFCWFYFVKRDAGGRDLELEDVFDRNRIVSESDLHVVVIVLLFSVADKGVKILDDIGSDSVSFARFSVTVVARVTKVEDLVLFGFCLKGSAMSHERFLSNFLEANPTNS